MPYRSRLLVSAAVSMVFIGACMLLVSARSGFDRVFAQAAQPAARGCTVTGSSGNDRLVGTAASDVICGLGGNDVIFAGAGDDVVVGAGGNDVIDGGAGRDFVSGGSGVDSIVGGVGADQISGGSGQDRLSVGVGDVCAPDRGDVVQGSCGSDRLPPAIRDVSVPSSVAAGSVLTVSWRVVDRSGVDSNGVLSGSAATTLAVGGAPGWVTWCEPFRLGTLVSGDAFDGRYQVSCAVPSNAVNDRYSVWIAAVDVFGNRAESAGAVSFNVTGGSSDQDVPVVSGLSSDAVVYQPGGTVVLRWRATDASGVAGVIPWAFGPNGRLTDDAGGLWLSYASGVLVAGDERDGMYEVALRLSQSALPGRYSLWLSVRDVVGNRSFEGYAPGGVPFVFEVR